MKPCRYCGRDVVWLAVRGVKPEIPFDRRTITREQDATRLGFVPVMRLNLDGGVVMVPICELSDRRLIDVERVALRHLCQQFMDARMRVLALDWADDDMLAMLMTLPGSQQRR